MIETTETYEIIPSSVPTCVETADVCEYRWREPFDYLAAVARDAQRWTDSPETLHAAVVGGN